MTPQELADLKPHTRTFGLLEWSIQAAAMLRQQAEQIEALKKMLVISDDTHQSWMKENGPGGWIDDLRKENESLKADAERLNWLSEMAHKRFGVTLDHGKYAEDGLVLEHGYRVTYFHNQGDRHPTLRAAIDAMKEKS